MAPSSVMPRRRVRTIGAGLAIVLFSSVLGAAASVAGASVATASADPIADKQAEAAALARKIDAQGRQIQVLAEQYDGARLHAAQVNQQLKIAAGKLSQAAQQAAGARAALGQQALAAYVHGGYLAPPKTSPYAGHLELVVQKAYFGLATDNEAQALDQMRIAQRNLAEQQAALQVTQKDSHDAVVALAARQVAIEQASAASKATLGQVHGELVQLVAEQQARLEAQQIAQEKAALAAQLAKAQAQARAAAAAAQAQALAQAQAQARAQQAAAVAQAQARAHATTTPPASPITVSPPTGPAPRPTGRRAPPGSSRGMIALNFAQAQLGKWYEWGASGPDTFDCSGLTMRAWEAAGVSLPHLAAAQYADVAHVAIADLQPGDLVFFGSDIHHVGIYAGNGQMIDAPYTGVQVRYDSIFWGDLIGAGRPG
jgi:peptidoglycan DL-endopeptidase CwlO